MFGSNYNFLKKDFHQQCLTMLVRIKVFSCRAVNEILKNLNPSLIS